jgi:hypothetical protein
MRFLLLEKEAEPREMTQLEQLTRPCRVEESSIDHSQCYPQARQDEGVESGGLACEVQEVVTATHQSA